MALIKCPECGKDVSDKASACIQCGFPLSNMEPEASEPENKNEVVYYDLLQGKLKSIFDKGLDDGVEGICNENGFDYPYQVKDNRLYVTRHAGTVEYIIDGDFLVNQNGKYSGNIPYERRFDANCNSSLFGPITFKSDGTYSEISYGNTSKGTYIREDNIMVLCGGDTGNSPYGFLIYDGNLYKGSHIKEEEIDKLKEVTSKYGVSHTSINTIPVPRPATPLVKCPYCQSGNTKRISSTAKAVNIAMFGIFGNKRKYQWHCNNCNSDF